MLRRIATKSAIGIFTISGMIGSAFSQPAPRAEGAPAPPPKCGLG